MFFLKKPSLGCHLHCCCLFIGPSSSFSLGASLWSSAWVWYIASSSIVNMFELLLLEFPLDLGFSTFTCIQASSPSSLDLATIARVFFCLLWPTGVELFSSLPGLTFVGHSDCLWPYPWHL